MPKIDVFREVLQPEKVPTAAEELEEAGSELFKRLATQKARKRLGVEAFDLGIDGLQVPALSWIREIGKSVIAITLIDRHETSGGFAMMGVEAPLDQSITNGEAYIFGSSGVVNGVRRVFSGPIVDIYFTDETLIHMLQLQLSLPAYKPKVSDEYVRLARGLSTLELPVNMIEKNN